MPIQFTCPSCRKALSVPDEYAGATGPCPSCGAQDSVPVLPQAPPQAGTAPAPQAQPIASQAAGPGTAPPPAAQFATPSAMAGQPMAMPVREAGPRTSPAAIWSLVLSLASYIFCLSILSAIPGLILGIAARRSIATSQGRLKGGGLATAGILLSLLAILLTVASVVVGILVIPKAVESIEQANLGSETRRWARALVTRANDNNDQLPANLRDLRSEGYIQPWEGSGEEFEYLGRGLNMEDIKSGRILMYARKADSSGLRWVVHADGSVQQMGENDLRRRLRDQDVPEYQLP